MSFSDSQLRAYIAGNLPPDHASALEEKIADNRELEARLLAFDREQSAPIRDAFMSVPSPDHIAGLAAALPAAKPRKMIPANFAKIGFAASTLIAAILLSVLMTNRPGTAKTWREQVAIYQALYVTDTLSHIAPDPTVLSQQLERSSTALGRSLDVDAVRNLDGLSLLRAQVLGFNDTPLVQMAYLSENGVPIALCAVHIGSDAQAGVRAEVLSGLPSVSWSDGEFSYMIVGDIAPSRLERMAQGLQNTL